MRLPWELPETNAYEEQRRHRIEHNQRVLRELGLLDNPINAAAESRRRKAEEQQRQRAAERQRQQAAAAADGGGEEQQPVQAQPQRRSRRLQGEDAENVGMPRGRALPCARTDPRPYKRGWQPRQVDIAAVQAGTVDAALDSLNILRVKTMSNQALRTRIRKIKRVDKLHSFVRVLAASGMDELAEEAREALSQMCGGQPPPL